MLKKKSEFAFQAYRKFLEAITSNIDPDDRENFLQQNCYDLANLKEFDLVGIISRRKDTNRKWNDLLFNIANVNSVQRVKFLIEKGINQVIAPWRFKLMVYSEKIANFYPFLCYNCDPDTNIPPEFLPHKDQAFAQNNLVGFCHKHAHVLIVPMMSGNRQIGYLIVSDNGELEFTPAETAILRNIRNHLTALILRTWDYLEITQRMEKMNQLMQISHDLIKVLNLNNLEIEIVSLAIDFTNATRGFLVKKDADGNNLYQVQMNSNKQLLSTTTGISKTALSICQNNQSMLLTFNATQDQVFANSISVQDYAIQTIFCSPLVIDEEVYGYLYLDNFEDSTQEMYLNEEIIGLLLNQIGVAIKNARQYENMLQKSAELNDLELIKDEFNYIVAHELNTPLSIMQGYVSRLKRKLFADEEEHQSILGKLDEAVNKLNMNVKDITTMNLYNLAKTLPKAPVKIGDILDLSYQEVSILARNRHFQFKVEVEKDLPPVYANWEALHVMIHNIVLNAVRFTDDFGSVRIGARKSAYPQEMIDNKATLVVFVQDNGIGISSYRLKDIFRKFFELNEIYAHKTGMIEYRSSGLGLGLAISKRIADLHNGRIDIKSKEHEGTSVFIILPFK